MTYLTIVVAFGNPAKVVQSMTEYKRKNIANMKSKPVYRGRGWTLEKGINNENKRKMQEDLADEHGYVE